MNFAPKWLPRRHIVRTRRPGAWLENKSANNGECKIPELSDKDYRSVLNMDRIEKPSFVSSDVDLAGHNFVSYSLKRQSGELEYIGDGKLRHLTFVESVDRNYSFRGNLHCVAELCFQSRKVERGSIPRVQPSRRNTGFMVVEALSAARFNLRTASRHIALRVTPGRAPKHANNRTD